MEVGSHLQHDMIPHDTVSATLDAWLPGAGIIVWDWIPLLLHETSPSEYFSLHIVSLSEECGFSPVFLVYGKVIKAKVAGKRYNRTRTCENDLSRK